MYNAITEKYDTDIERLFYEKLLTSITVDEYKEKIKDVWKNDKFEYIEKLKIVKYEFVNYSLHDHTHSQAILQNIYEWLGQERAAKLSVGDLWLLLETAYSHDIGMATTYEDIEDLWKDKEKIKELMYEINLTEDKEIIASLSKIQEETDNKTIFSILQEDVWPLKVRKAVTYINATYFRKKHAELSKKYILSKIQKTRFNHNIQTYVEDRFYENVAIINYLHTQDDDKITSMLEEEADGFDTSGFDDDKIHPQMIAYLLRLGDVLDLKNNRFDLWIMEHNGALPKNSELHYQKHKSVTHFLVKPQKVEITIKSDDTEVCNCASEWLNNINHELLLLMRVWNQIVPANLKGFLIEYWSLKIYYNDILFNSEDFSKELMANSQKLMELLSGKNIYETKLVLFREYLQNAIDATKVKFASYYLDNKEFLDYISPKKFKDITPADIKEFCELNNTFEKINIDNLTIKIIVEPKDDSHCTIKIIDQGIGMDEEGLNALFNIGKGWSGRSERMKFNKFPSWLKPTGGFGIGILSGFLLCDHLTITTKAKKSPQYIVEIDAPKYNGKIKKRTTNIYYGNEGTTISFDLPYFSFIKEMRNFIVQFSIDKMNDEGVMGKTLNIFDESSLQIMMQNSIIEIINYYIKDLIFPIEVYSPKNKIIYFVKQNNLFDSKTNISNYETNGRQCYWNNKYNCLIVPRILLENKEMITSYKGMRVIKSIELLKDKYENDINKKKIIELAEDMFKLVDLNYDSVDDILSITRDKFKNEELFIKLLDNLLYDYLCEIASTNLDFINIFSYHSKESMQNLFLHYYNLISIKNYKFQSFINKLEEKHIFSLYQNIVNEKLYNDSLNALKCLAEIFNYLKMNEIETTSKKQFQSLIKNLKIYSEKAEKSINIIINSEIIINDNVNNYLKNMNNIIIEILKIIRSNIKDIEEEKTLVIKYAKNYIENYSSDYITTLKSKVIKATFFKLIFEKKDFYVIACDSNVHNNNFEEIDLNNKYCLFVDEYEFNNIDNIMTSGKITNYEKNDYKYVKQKLNYKVMYVKSKIEANNSYENLKNDIRLHIEATEFFIIKSILQEPAIEPIIITDIPSFSLNIQNNEKYIINPLKILNIKKKDDLLEILKNKKLKKENLEDYLLTKEYFKTLVKYITEINNVLEREVIDAYVKLFSDAFELS